MEYLTMIVLIAAVGVFSGCFAIVVRDRDKLQKGYNSLLKENKELRASNAEMMDCNYELLKKSRTTIKN